MKRVINKKYKNNYLFFVIITLFFLVIFLEHVLLIFSHGPLEAKEDATILITVALIEGINPFSLNNSPRWLNVHGILYNLLVYPLALIIGPDYFSHRLISAVGIFLSCSLLAYVLKKLKVSYSISLLAGVVFYAQLVVGAPRGTPGGYEALSRPDSLGLFLFLSSVFLPLINDHSTKSLMISGLCSLLGFFTKPYFFIGIIANFIILLIFYSKRKAFIYFFALLMFLLVALGIVNRFMEMYIFDVLYIHMGLISRSIFHLIIQMNLFIIWNLTALVIIGLWLLDKRQAVANNTIKNINDRLNKLKFKADKKLKILVILLIQSILCSGRVHR